MCVKTLRTGLTFPRWSIWENIAIPDMPKCFDHSVKNRLIITLDSHLVCLHVIINLPVLIDHQNRASFFWEIWFEGSTCLGIHMFLMCDWNTINMSYIFSEHVDSFWMTYDQSDGMVTCIGVTCFECFSQSRFVCQIWNSISSFPLDFIRKVLFRFYK